MNTHPTLTVHKNGIRVWTVYDQTHRLDGPAVDYTWGLREWYIMGEEMTEEDHRPYQFVKWLKDGAKHQLTSAAVML